MRVVLLLGEPGSGKTALVKQVISHLGAPASRELKLQVPMANGQPTNIARATLFPDHKVVVPGVYDGSLFEGTDRLGRNTTPALTEMVLRFARLTADKNALGWNVLCEGDRIATTTFVDAVLDAEIQLVVYRLLVDDEECAQRKFMRELTYGADFFNNTASKTVAGKPRRTDRLETGLDPTWVAGRRTKVNNLANHVLTRGGSLLAVPNEGPDNFARIVEYIEMNLGVITGGPSVATRLHTA